MFQLEEGNPKEIGSESLFSIRLTLPNKLTNLPRKSLTFRKFNFEQKMIQFHFFSGEYYK